MWWLKNYRELSGSQGWHWWKIPSELYTCKIMQCSVECGVAPWFAILAAFKWGGFDSSIPPRSSVIAWEFSELKISWKLSSSQNTDVKHRWKTTSKYPPVSLQRCNYGFCFVLTGMESCRYETFRKSLEVNTVLKATQEQNEFNWNKTWFKLTLLIYFLGFCYL